MSCCSLEYRKVVNEEEKKINEKGKDTLPLFVKIISLLIIAGALGIALI
ncbi:hypothetical protein [Mesobacillus maritimus]|uniref:Uncharacterized protein n=1 Tax=Mesobacillus maritimus TaxID=1643336 RepID=A0ABS7K9X9_9BACI|nr:hypothetical protein [Mesobacillus maritimus]MBY0098910.1 hypothetical protein [Mesobacillus maritimus]